MRTSSAVPGWLLRYGDQATQLDDHLARRARDASLALQAFAATAPDLGRPRHDPAADAVDHALRNREVDAWVGRVGEAFRRADLAAGGGWWCRIPAEPLVVADAVIAASAGYATNDEAARAGASFAATVTAALDEYGDIDASTIERWRDTMRAHTNDPAYTAAFYERLGAHRALWLVKAVEDHYPHDELGRPRWGLAAIRPFSEALATAMSTRHDPHLRDRFRLTQRFVDTIVVPPRGWDGSEPEEHHLGLLFREGRFPTDVLLALGRNVVDRHLGSTFRAGPFGFNAWGPADDPVANVLGAIAKDEDASYAHLARTGVMRTFLERWANDLDGDLGRNASRVLERALTHERSDDLFRDAVAITAELGEVRNWFNHRALAAGTAAHIDDVTATAAALGGHGARKEVHAFLTVLLSDADPKAAARVYDAAARHTYDLLGQAGANDTLGSELMEIGSLFGLVVAADEKAKVDDAEDRIARRDALLDAITQVTDLGLTFTAGKWIPFAKTGRNALVDSFRHTDELTEAVTSAREFEDELVLRLHVAVAVRMVQTGKLPPPPGGLPTAIGDGDLGALRTWVNTPDVRDVIVPAGADAGYYMLRVERDVGAG